MTHTEQNEFSGDSFISYVPQILEFKRVEIANEEGTLGSLIFRLDFSKFGRRLLNGKGTVHAGIIGTINSTANYIACLAFNPRPDAATFSVNLSIDYLKAIMPNDDVELECKVLKVGRSVAFTSAHFYKIEKDKRSLLAVTQETFAFAAKKVPVEPRL